MTAMREAVRFLKRMSVRPGLNIPTRLLYGLSRRFYQQFFSYLEPPERIRTEVRERRLIQIFFQERGLAESAERGVSINAAGEPIPWFSYPAVDYLMQLDLTAAAVFEYGMGNSTLFWVKRVRRVVAVDNDPEWYRQISAIVGNGAELSLLTDPDRYVEALKLRPEKFDVIVIDGRFRGRCAEGVADRLNAGGIVILDDSHRLGEEREALEILQRDARFLRVDFRGIGPILPEEKVTTFFIDRACARKVNFSPLRRADEEAQ